MESEGSECARERRERADRQRRQKSMSRRENSSVQNEGYYKLRGVRAGCTQQWYWTRIPLPDQACSATGWCRLLNITKIYMVSFSSWPGTTLFANRRRVRQRSAMVSTNRGTRCKKERIRARFTYMLVSRENLFVRFLRKSFRWEIRTSHRYIIYSNVMLFDRENIFLDQEFV